MPGSALLKPLTAEQARAVLNLHGPQLRSSKDAQLIRARDPASPLLTLISGWAFRYSLLPNGKRQILSLALPGDTIGLDTLLTGAPVYPVQSATAVVYCVMRQDQACELLREADWFREQALNALARDRIQAEAALTRIGQCTAEERVAAVLLDLYKDLSKRGLAASNTFPLELTQQHLADWLGLTVVHLNRVLGRFKSRRLISMDRNQITLLDPAALACLSFAPVPSEPTAVRG